jgi:plasmid stabilization system protein ParE
VARLVYSENALANLERLFAFLEPKDPDVALAAVVAIRSAVEMLEAHPLIGRIVTKDLRELVISFGETGYVALYRFHRTRDEVRVLAVRHQRELDYP